MQYYVTHKDFERVNKDKPITTKQLEDLKIKIMRQFQDFQEELANIYGNKQ